MYPHVAELFMLDGTTIGERTRTFFIEGVDAKAALFVMESLMVHREIGALYQGNLECYGIRPVGFTGRWSIAEWEQIRDAHGGGQAGVQGVRAALAARRAPR